MDKSCHSSGDSSTTTATSSSASITNTTTNNNNNNNNNRDQYLNHLNKISHKISKPIRRPTPTFDHHHQVHRPPPPPPPPPPQSSQSESLQPQPPQQHQPPVYNINKSDFRDVVQKLTGSPAHERFSKPPPIQPPKPPSSRLQRIRPPPLAQISNRPPPLLHNAVPPPQPNHHPHHPMSAAVNGGNSNQRAVAPLSPLPPFPTVHAAAESPISAYMRYLQTSISAFESDPKRFTGLSPLAPLVSPRWNNLGPPPPPPPQNHHQPPLPLPQHNVFPAPTQSSPFLMPTSPLPFGCIPSPRSPYPLLSPSLLFSPSTTGQLGFQQFPISPRLPVPSPRWKDC